MNIQKQNFLSEDKTKAILFPIFQQESLEKNIEKIADLLGVEKKYLAATFLADYKEVLPIIPSANSSFSTVYLLGLGKKNDFISIQNAFRSFIFKYNKKLSADIVIEVAGLPAEIVEPILNGIYLGLYNIGLHKTDTANEPVFNLKAGTLTFSFDEEIDMQVENYIQRTRSIAETQMRIFDLVNSPANFKTPEDLGDWVKKSAKKYKYDVKVLDKKHLEKEKCGALLAIGQGSEHPPVMIIAEYKPKNADKYANLKKIGLVGKGVTFDTGGISIKGSNNMFYMKSDMGGAAAVLGIIEVAAKLNLPYHIIAVVPATENCVDAKAIKPSDVITSYMGKTIEMIDTDAEGRVILADGLAYLNKNYQPDIILDFATLTGSIIQSLGYAAAGLFTNNDALAKELEMAGNAVGERLWRMPIWEIYADDIKSDVADLRNYSNKPTAGAISAAKFLEVFTENHTAWAHIDIAGVAFADSEYSSMRSSTAYGIRLVLEWLKSENQK